MNNEVLTNSYKTTKNIMSKHIFKSIIVAAAIMVCGLTPKTSVAQDQPITIQTFYDQLTPYGQWINYPAYGYVFIPNVGPGFIPYSTAGHWEYTDAYGWTWASDYPWGWACFHYGRWNFDPSYGWFWVPDLQWGPAWVVWRNSEEYYGWAPLPSGIDISMNINNGYGIPSDYWCFVPNRYMGDPYIYNYYMPRGNNDIYVMHSALIFRMNYDNDHRYCYYAGPERYEVERYRHSPIQPTFVTFTATRQQVYAPNTFYRPGWHDGDHHDDGGRHDDGIRHDNCGTYVPRTAVNIQDVPQRDADHRHYNDGNYRGGDRHDDHGGDHHDDGGDNHDHGHH